MSSESTRASRGDGDRENMYPTVAARTAGTGAQELPQGALAARDGGGALVVRVGDVGAGDGLLRADEGRIDGEGSADDGAAGAGHQRRAGRDGRRAPSQSTDCGAHLLRSPSAGTGRRSTGNFMMRRVRRSVTTSSVPGELACSDESASAIESGDEAAEDTARAELQFKDGHPTGRAAGVSLSLCCGHPLRGRRRRRMSVSPSARAGSPNHVPHSR